MAIGFTFPFAKSTGSIGYLETTNTELAAVEQNFKSLLLTNWGERVMHADFGCNLIEFLFEQQVNNELQERIGDRIVSQVNKWMPFVSIDKLNLIFSDTDSSLPENSMRIHIQYHLNSKPDLVALFNLIISV